MGCCDFVQQSDNLQFITDLKRYLFGEKIRSNHRKFDVDLCSVSPNGMHDYIVFNRSYSCICE